MKLLVVLLLGLVGLSIVSAQLPSDAEILKLLENPRIRVPIFKCLMDNGTCAGNGGKVKKALLETMKNNCSTCTPSDKERAAKMMKIIRNQYPIEWSKLVAKYDPHGTYERKLRAQIEKQS